jgi:exodeoxyribonuclease VIII
MCFAKARQAGTTIYTQKLYEWRLKNMGMGKNNIMVDLETMGNRGNAAIVSIGAVRFDPTGLKEEFYKVIDLDSSVMAGMDIDVSTVSWWLRQGAEARKIFTDVGVTSLKAALVDFKIFIGKGAEVWGNGADFDNVILKSAYDAVELPLPWQYWNNRCYRTMKGLYKQVKLDRTGTHHNALDDAKTQAEHLIRIFKYLEKDVGKLIPCTG